MSNCGTQSYRSFWGGWLNCLYKIKNRNIGEKMENINKKRTGKLLLVLNMLMLIALMTVPAYAFFWNNRTVDRSPDVVTGEVTEGLVVLAESTPDSTKRLIPLSAEFSDVTLEVKELVYTITVGLDINEKLDKDKLHVSVELFTTDAKGEEFDPFLSHIMYKSEAKDNVTVTIKFTIALTAAEWTDAHNDVTHKVNVKLSLDPIVPTA